MHFSSGDEAFAAIWLLGATVFTVARFLYCWGRPLDGFRNEWIDRIMVTILAVMLTPFDVAMVMTFLGH